MPSLAGTAVTPVVGALTYDLAGESRISDVFPGNDGEVDGVFAVSVRDLLMGETSEPLPRLGGREAMMGPVFHTDYGKVWGLTAIIMRPLLHRVLRPVGFYEGGDM